MVQLLLTAVRQGYLRKIKYRSRTINCSNIHILRHRHRVSFKLDDYIEFTLSSGTYSIDVFNKEIRAAVLQQKQNWNSPHIKNLQLVVPENYAFIAEQ